LDFGAAQFFSGVEPSAGAALGVFGRWRVQRGLHDERFGAWGWGHAPTLVELAVLAHASEQGAGAAAGDAFGGRRSKISSMGEQGVGAVAQAGAKALVVEDVWHSSGPLGQQDERVGEQARSRDGLGGQAGALRQHASAVVGVGVEQGSGERIVIVQSAMECPVKTATYPKQGRLSRRGLAAVEKVKGRKAPAGLWRGA
jgi:hypothetical protein